LKAKINVFFTHLVRVSQRIGEASERPNFELMCEEVIGSFCGDRTEDTNTSAGKVQLEVLNVTVRKLETALCSVQVLDG
jgi:hypothetical protein